MKPTHLSPPLLTLVLLLAHLLAADSVELRKHIGPAAPNGPVGVVRDLSKLSGLIGSNQGQDEQDQDHDQDDTQLQRGQPVGLATIWQEAKWGRGAAGPLGLREIRLLPVGRKRTDLIALELFGHELLNATEQVGPDYVDFQQNLLQRPKRLLNGGEQAHKFLYVVSPLSQLAHPIQSERLRQGYRNLVPLSGSYQTGLERVSDNVFGSLIDSAGSAARELGNACRTRRELVQLTRDETDPASGRLVRRCGGQVELASCEGLCQSGVQPSVKSASGFVKKCSCCTEATFRRVQVRLSDCSLVQEVVDPVGQLGSFMDVELEEPIDCACRQCDSLL